MKKFIIIIILLLSIITPYKFEQIFANSFTNNSNLVLYQGEVEHLFTHCLIAFPEIAFKKDNEMAKHYDTDCILPEEFYSILQSLYEKNYCLININDTFIEKNGRILKQEIFLPKNKKPLILSFDDVNYDHKKQGLGMVDKLIINGNKVASQTTINGKKIVSYKNEFVPILDNFVNEHPDFSPFGAKGTICLTGYDGILGYRTQSKNTINRNDEINEAKKVVNALKATGWNFACHSYGHYHMKKISIEDFNQELFAFENEVESIVGKTNVYVYPYGEWEISKNNKICEKHKLLAQKFKLFCGVGMKTFFSYLPFTKQIKEKYLFMDRKVMDGSTLRTKANYFAHLFDCKKIISNKRNNYY